MKRNTLSVCLAVLVVVISTILSSSVSAQEPELDYFIYLPLVSVDRPTPYNLRASDFVLEPSDMPSGYALDPEESGPVEFSDTLLQMGAVDGYENYYFNYDLILTGTPLVDNIAVVFKNPSGAQEYIEFVERNVVEDPDLFFVSVPTIGDETIAYGTISSSATAYAIVFRRGNLISVVITSALSVVSDFGVTISFAQLSLGKINDQIGS